MLNFNKGIEIAKIISGKDKNKIIKLDLETKNHTTNKIKTDGEIQIIPSKLSRIFYITGKSGAGKSTFAGKYVKEYSKLEPEGEIFYLSRKDFYKDPAYNKLGFDPIIIDPETFGEDDVNIDITEDLNENKTTMFLFDDISTFEKGKLKKIEHLINEIGELGRANNAMLTLTNHLIIPNNKEFARILMNEMQMLTFPTRGNISQVKYVLEKYFGLNNKQIYKILETNSRFITIYNGYPTLVIEDYKIYIL